LALVAESGREFYVELVDAWQVEDSSQFVVDVVLPQLWGGVNAMLTKDARAALLEFLGSFEEELEVVTDAPRYDWRFFQELAYDNGRWPTNVRNDPTDATTLTATSDGKELPHHALLDARIIAGMFKP